MEKKNIKIVQDYVKELRKNHVQVKNVYLFGSYAKKSYLTSSDIDVAVISDSFSGDWFEDMKLLLKVRRAVDIRIEPLPFRPEDFNRSQPLYHQILKEGIKVV